MGLLLVELLLALSFFWAKEVNCTEDFNKINNLGELLTDLETQVGRKAERTDHTSYFKKWYYGLLQKLPKGVNPHLDFLVLLATSRIENFIKIHAEDGTVLCKVSDRPVVLYKQNVTENCSTPNEDELKKHVMKACFSKRQANSTRDTPLTTPQVFQELWDLFENVFGVITYKPVFKLLIQKILMIAGVDKVTCLVLQIPFFPLYDLDNGRVIFLNISDFVETIKTQVIKFKKTNTHFFSLKLKHSGPREMTEENLKKAIAEYQEAVNYDKDMIAGFDLASQKNSGRSLESVAKILSPPIGNYFFHAGHTNWNFSANEDLLDAVALGAKVVSDPYVLLKHPSLLQLVSQKKIVLEVCPPQVNGKLYKYNENPAVDPAVMFIAMGFPVVIYSDDVTLDGDFTLTNAYSSIIIAFSMFDSFDERTILLLMKRLVLNSFEYSTLSKDDKLKAISMWQTVWDKTMKDSLNLYESNPDRYYPVKGTRDYGRI